MFRTHFARSFATKMAVFAILLGTLMPAVSHLLRAGGSDGWVEVCTSLGSKWVSTDSSESSGSQQAPSVLHALEHCPYCSLHAGALGLPPEQATVALQPVLRPEIARRFLAAPHAQITWIAGQPRAPPPVD